MAIALAGRMSRTTVALGAMGAFDTIAALLVLSAEVKFNRIDEHHRLGHW
eukprot:CAMPEP_0114001026 /NCGR_PEP_ID=MMETSP0372-20130328/666_1 /TAXON_ID=340204 /ORGANISM="Lankesteria abbotti" /LENGTH=49 /assembly_acc=CAM_ASM_000359